MHIATKQEDTMHVHEQEKIRAAVRSRYSQIATALSNDQQEKGQVPNTCCDSKHSSPAQATNDCGCSPTQSPAQQSGPRLGYTTKDLDSAPLGSNMGLGCGNPVALASIKPGETVVDLGSGGGFDCFLAADKVGPEGLVIGIDMTAEMVSKARHNAQKATISNVEFRLAEIEHLPIADNCADLIISNCVINLSTEKRQVFRDAFRVLKPGGRLAISDILATAPLPPEIQNDLAQISACVGGAATLDDTRAMLESAGFEEIRIETPKESREAIEACTCGSKAGDYVTSAYIQASKPK